MNLIDINQNISLFLIIINKNHMILIVIKKFKIE